MSSVRFALLVPVKTWERAKSRLGVADPLVRKRLVRAFAQDAISAALRSEAVASVYLVTAEVELDAAGCTLLPDEGMGDLNWALAVAAVRVAGLEPGLAVAAMCADVPCLVPEDLTAALSAIARTGRGFVADASGTGTTLLGTLAGRPLDPRFGLDSAREHEESDAAPVGSAVTSLRLDVDTLEDLAAATALGVGPHTRAVLDHL